MNISLEASLGKGYFPPMAKEKSSSSYKPRRADLENLHNTNKVTVNNDGIEETLAGLENIREGSFQIIDS